MRINKLFAGGVTIVALAFALTVSGVPADAQSLQDALAAAYTNNPELLAQRAEGLLATVGLKDRMAHRPAQLSGGERQRVAIARALVNDPDILLADEPTGNLDPETSDGVFTALTRLARERNLAALIATHNHDLAAATDRVLTLEHGLIEPSR